MSEEHGLLGKENFIKDMPAQVDNVIIDKIAHFDSNHGQLEESEPGALEIALSTEEKHGHLPNETIDHAKGEMPAQVAITNAAIRLDPGDETTSGINHTPAKPLTQDQIPDLSIAQTVDIKLEPENCMVNHQCRPPDTAGTDQSDRDLGENGSTPTMDDQTTQTSITSAPNLITSGTATNPDHTTSAAPLETGQPPSPSNKVATDTALKIVSSVVTGDSAVSNGDGTPSETATPSTSSSNPCSPSELVENFASRGPPSTAVGHPTLLVSPPASTTSTSATKPVDALMAMVESQPLSRLSGHANGPVSSSFSQQHAHQHAHQTQSSQGSQSHPQHQQHHAVAHHPPPPSQAQQAPQHNLPSIFRASHHGPGILSGGGSQAGLTSPQAAAAAAVMSTSLGVAPPPSLHTGGLGGGPPVLYYCHLCPYSGTSREGYAQHIDTHYPLKCPYCEYKSKTEGRLKKHIRDSHAYLDQRSGSEPGESNSGSESPSSAAMAAAVPQRPRTYRCRQCNYLAPTKTEYWQHNRSHIKPEKLLECPRCEFVTEYKHHLEYHLRNHFGSKPFKCPKCPYSCVNKSMLNSHMKSHATVYQYRCADCNYATKYCHSLKVHLMKYNHKPATVLTPEGGLVQDGGRVIPPGNTKQPPHPRLTGLPGMTGAGGPGIAASVGGASGLSGQAVAAAALSGGRFPGGGMAAGAAQMPNSLHVPSAEEISEAYAAMAATFFNVAAAGAVTASAVAPPPLLPVAGGPLFNNSRQYLLNAMAGFQQQQQQHQHQVSAGHHHHQQGGGHHHRGHQEQDHAAHHQQHPQHHQAGAQGQYQRSNPHHQTPSQAQGRHDLLSPIGPFRAAANSAGAVAGSVQNSMNRLPGTAPAGEGGEVHSGVSGGVSGAERASGLSQGVMGYTGGQGGGSEMYGQERGGYPCRLCNTVAPTTSVLEEHVMRMHVNKGGNSDDLSSMNTPGSDANSLPPRSSPPALESMAGSGGLEALADVAGKQRYQPTSPLGSPPLLERSNSSGATQIDHGGENHVAQRHGQGSPTETPHHGRYSSGAYVIRGAGTTPDAGEEHLPPRKRLYRGSQGGEPPDDLIISPSKQRTVAGGANSATNTPAASGEHQLVSPSSSESAELSQMTTDTQDRSERLDDGESFEFLSPRSQRATAAPGSLSERRGSLTPGTPKSATTPSTPSAESQLTPNERRATGASSAGDAGSIYNVLPQVRQLSEDRQNQQQQAQLSLQHGFPRLPYGSTDAGAVQPRQQDGGRHLSTSYGAPYGQHSQAHQMHTATEQQPRGMSQSYGGNLASAPATAFGSASLTSPAFAAQHQRTAANLQQLPLAAGAYFDRSRAAFRHRAGATAAAAAGLPAQTAGGDNSSPEASTPTPTLYSIPMSPRDLAHQEQAMPNPVSGGVSAQAAPGGAHSRGDGQPGASGSGSTSTTGGQGGSGPEQSTRYSTSSGQYSQGDTLDNPGGGVAGGSRQDPAGPPNTTVQHRTISNLYECAHCELLFRNCEMYMIHMGYHCYRDPYLCNMCGKKCADKMEFFMHLNRDIHNC